MNVMIVGNECDVSGICWDWTLDMTNLITTKEKLLKMKLSTDYCDEKKKEEKIYSHEGEKRCRQTTVYFFNFVDN